MPIIVTDAFQAKDPLGLYRDRASPFAPAASGGTRPAAYPPLEGNPGNDYNTPLTDSEEQAFEAWKAKVAPDDSGDDYDLRGAFKAGLTPSANGHFSDRFKKPNHTTFSDESMYARYAPDLAGHWDGDTYVPSPSRARADAEAATAAANAATEQSFGALEAKAPGRYKIIPAAEYDKWQADWDKANRSTGLLGDTVRLLDAGTAEVEQGINEIVGQIPGIGKPLQSLADKFDAFAYGSPGYADRLQGVIDKDVATLTPETADARNAQWWDPKTNSLGSAWLNPRSYYAGLVESLPSTALTMLPGGLLARGAYVSAIARGATTRVAAAAAAKSAMIAGALTEGGLGGAQTSQQVRQAIAQMPRDKLVQTDAVQALVKQGMNEDQAIDAITNDAATQGFLMGGVATGLFGGFGDRFLARLVAEGVGGSLARRIVEGATRGIVAEGLLEELPQEGLGQLAQNEALKNTVNPEQDLLEGVPNAALGGAAIGAAMGGAFGGFGGAVRPSHEAEPVAEAPAIAPLAPVTPPSGPLATALARGAEAAASSAPAPVAPVDDMPIAGERTSAPPPVPVTAAPLDPSQLPRPGETVRVAAPGLEPFTGRIDSYADTEHGPEALVANMDTGEVLQLPVQYLGQANLSDSDVAALDRQDSPPLEREKQEPTPDNSREVAADPRKPGVRMVFPDQLHAALYDLGRQRRLDKGLHRLDAGSKTASDGSLELNQRYPEERQRLADAFEVPLSRVTDLADDYRFRTERAARGGSATGLALNMHKVPAGVLARFQNERLRTEKAGSGSVPDLVEAGTTTGSENAPPAPDAESTTSLPTSSEAQENVAIDTDTIDAAAHEAATSPHNDRPEPTEAQKEAGNYKLGHLSLGGLDISIENPAGSTRSGTDRDGTPWSVEMKHHYGYIRGTVGRDKDHVDVFVKTGTAELGDAAPVFVVDQVEPANRAFDEHKVMLGFGSLAQARNAYRANYAKGWKGAGAVTATTLGAFKRWLGEGDTTKPFASPAESGPHQQAAGEAQVRKSDANYSDPMPADAEASEAGTAAALKSKGATAAEHTVTTPTGLKISVRPEIVDASSLRAATGALQPRDRGRAASTAQIEDIALHLDPDRLMLSPEADRGAPIVGPDNIVESGNGRLAALRRAAEAYPDRFARYRDALRAAGYAVPGEGVPVLIGRRTSSLTDEDRRAFVVGANKPATAVMSATELAANDAAALSPAILSLRGRDQERAYLDTLPQAERSALVDSSGMLNADGRRRLRNAIFAAAYERPDVVERMAESTDDNARAITSAMAEVAGDWAAMREDIRAGHLDPDLDFTGALVDALVLISRARDKAAEQARPVHALINEAVGQVDMFSGALPAQTVAIVRAFYRGDDFRRAVSTDRIAAFLRTLVSEVRAIGQPSLLGDRPEKSDIVDAVRTRTTPETDRDAERQETLFGADFSAQEDHGPDRRPEVRAPGAPDGTADAARDAEALAEPRLALPRDAAASGRAKRQQIVAFVNGLDAPRFDRLMARYGGADSFLKLAAQTPRPAQLLDQVKGLADRGAREDDGEPEFSASDTPVIALRGDELGAGDPAALRRAALRWYADNLVGEAVKTADGATVLFNRVGARETVQSAPADLLRAVPAIRRIIEAGRVVRRDKGASATAAGRLDTIGARIAAVRGARGMTITEMARALELSPQRFGQYERGQRSIPHDVLDRFRKLTGATSDYLLFGESGAMPLELMRALSGGPEEVSERVVIAAPVEIGGVTRQLAVTVNRTPDGRFHYDLVPAAARGDAEFSAGTGTAPALNLEGWGEVEGAEPPALSAEEEAELTAIVRRVSGLDEATFHDRITMPAGNAGWGNDAPRSAAGLYDPAADVVVLARSSATARTAYHEAFHRLQRLFLTPEERAIMARETSKLRRIVGSFAWRRDQVARMSQKELEAEAFAIWASGADVPVKPHTTVAAAWARIRQSIERAGNYLRGLGWQISEDVFSRARSGRIARRDAARTGTSEPSFQHGLDITRRTDRGELQFDDEVQARVYDLGQALLRLNRLSSSGIAGGAELPATIPLGARSTEARRLLEEIGPYLDPPARSVQDLARAAVETAALDQQLGAGRVGSLIDPDEYYAWSQRLAEGLRREARDGLAAPAPQPAFEFSEADQTPLEPVAELSGDELGVAFTGPADMPALRRAAMMWYRDNLLGKNATMGDGSLVRFSRQGMGKSTSNGKGDVLLRSVPAIRAIIEKGRVMLREPGRRPGVLSRIVIAAPVRLSGVQRNLAVSVHATTSGQLQYDFTFDRDAEDGTPGMTPGGAPEIGSLPSLEVPRSADRNVERPAPADKSDGDERDYSMADAAPHAAGAARRARDEVAGRWTDVQPKLLAAAPLAYFSELARPGMAAVKGYLKVKRDMDAYRGARHAAADEIAQRWLKVTRLGFGLLSSAEGKAVAARLADLMHAATLAGVDPTRTDSASVAMPGYAGLRQQLAALPPAARELFGTVRDAYKQQAHELDKLILEAVEKAHKIAIQRAETAYLAEKERIKASGLSEPDLRAALEEATGRYGKERLRSGYANKARLTQLRKSFEASRVQEPYFPLARFGRHFVTVRDVDGTVLSFSRRERAADATRLAREMREAYPGKTIETGVMDEAGAGLREAMDPRLVAEIEHILGSEGVDASVMDAIWQRYLQSMPDLSTRKRFIHRKGTAGFDADALRAFSSHMFHAAHQMARLKYGVDLQEQLDQAAEQARKADDPTRAMTLVNELGKRHQWVMNPQGSAAVQAVTSAMFLWYLGLTPASAIVNLTQTPMLGVPILGAKFGLARSSAALLGATRDFVAGKGSAQRGRLSEEERWAMERFYESGLIDRTRSHDLAGVGSTGVNYSPLRARVMAIASWGFHMTEVANREVTALAAFRLARAAGQDAFAALDSAHEMTWKIHFDYSNSSRPRILQSDAAKLVGVFQNYQLNMWYRLFRDLHQSFAGDTPQARREARYQLAGITGMMTLLGGVTGLFGFHVLMAIAGMFFGDKDDPYDFEEQMKRHVVDLFGPDVGGMILNGVPGQLTGIDLTSRIGMPDFFVRAPDDPNLDGRDWWEQFIVGALGVVPNTMINMGDGASLIAQGNTVRGLELMMPKALKDVMQAYRFANEGLTTRNRDEIMPASAFGAWETLAKIAGFTPAAVTESYDRNSALYAAEDRVANARSLLLNQLAMAIAMGDEDGQDAVLERIRAFNAVPAHRAVQITAETIRASLRARARNEAKREDGVLIQNEGLSRDLRGMLPERIN